MEQRERAQAALAGIEDRLGTAAMPGATPQARCDAALADLDKEREWRAGSRAPLVADLPADLVAALREDPRVVGDRARRCCGPAGARAAGWNCPASERARVRAARPTTCVRCEECAPHPGPHRGVRAVSR